jgi:predicted  nucleic acid-binding Zn-ribbon protein
MVDSNIEKLLILQDRDARRLEIENQLAAIPGEILGVEKRIAAEKEKLDSAKSRIRSLEVSRKDLDNQIASAEDQVSRYKNQQLQVKKNEEYQALTHEIELTGAKIGKLEEQGIEVLIALDEERQKVAEIEKDFAQVIGQLEEKIANLKQRMVNCGQELEERRAEVEVARTKVEDPAYLMAYDRALRVVRFPVVVAVVDRTCQGCHLRVSGDVDAEARETGKITTCDSCGRIVYYRR